MSIFDLHSEVVRDYQHYVQSFLSIADDRVRQFVEGKLLQDNVFWPAALVQLNPSYERAKSTDELSAEGVLVPETASIFKSPTGTPLQLYRHQCEAIARATMRESYVVTSGTGSGKSLTYFIPIFDAILRGDPAETKVRAIVIYPMNALVNSQEDSLKAFSAAYQQRTGQAMPVRFAKYTGQEDDAERRAIQQQPPHILLTNFMMLEMMLLRPQEAPFVDHAKSALQFLVLDELHMYRGRQGADVSMLIRRLKERCGNQNLQHIGTSATMVANRSSSGVERRQAVADFASKLFGSSIPESNVVEEFLVPVSQFTGTPTADELRKCIEDPLPTEDPALLRNALTSWVESTVGIEPDSEGRFCRKTPQTLTRLAARLSDHADVPAGMCEERLREVFLAGSHIRQSADGSPFAFKLHQFISQGRAVFATIEDPASRFLTLEGQYYAPANPESDMARLLYPLLFCRVCGQEYYRVRWNEQQSQMIPWTETSFDDDLETGRRGYLLVPPTEVFTWSDADLPPDLLELNGRIKRGFRNRVPCALDVQPDGAVLGQPDQHSIRAFFQETRFLICQTCGAYYTGREGDFQKLSGLSSEGRSSATTTLSISALEHAEKAHIEDSGRKLLSFTDNRQDASLQAGHFNDFVLVSLLRAALVDALDRRGALRHHDIAGETVSSLGLGLGEIARNPHLDEHSALASTTRKAFHDLIEYRLYEDLRRAWRVVHPNLEQCGLLQIEYEGLEQCAKRDDIWREIPDIAALNPRERIELLTPVLDFARKKLAIHSGSLREVYQQQLRQRVNQVINERWCFDDSEERLRSADKLILPDQLTGRVAGISMGKQSLIGRYFRKRLPGVTQYLDFIRQLVTILVNQGLFRRETERGVDFIQLESAVLLWKKGLGNPPPPDPIYSRRAPGAAYTTAQQEANHYFRELYQRRARHLKDVEGQEHTAQIKYANREERERRFRSGELKVLFCSPTMELGIDISDLQLVHMRNVPPSPASYAQRSGRAGRKGDPALILTYCSALSGHDQYFFQRREDIVAGAVRPPRIDLSNEDLVRAHIHAVWFAKVNLRIDHSIEELLDIQRDELPLKDNVNAQIHLSESRLAECLSECQRVLAMCSSELADAAWFHVEWLEETLKRAPDAFGEALNRWRDLFRAATKQLLDAQRQEATALDTKVQAEARQKIDEAKRQRNLLMNIGTTKQESDFYPYRYLASEGFLPGYNFPRLPIRIYVPREDGEFISRARFLALSEFGPGNTVYHEGAKYQVNRFWAPPGGLASRRTQAKLCNVCGCYNDESNDQCSHCKTILDGSTSLYVNLLAMPNGRTIRRQRITCDEEERVRRGYEISTHFNFATGGGQPRIVDTTVGKDPAQPLMRAVYAPQATLHRVNHGWKRQADGFLVDLSTGEIDPQTTDAQNLQRIRLFVQDTDNILLVYPPPEIQQDESAMASLQFALQRGMEQCFQIEEMELASERIGNGDRRAILYWEASEGGVGILRRMVDEADSFAAVATAALDRLHFGGRPKPDCVKACYECLLSYSNQPDHKYLNRDRVHDLLTDLAGSIVTTRHGGRDYEAHYQWLSNLTDSRSELERRFIEHLHRTRRDLPDNAQRAITEVNTIPDFYYPGQHACIFCDGSVHDDAAQVEKDASVRKRLRDHGYRTIVIRYDKNIEDQISAYPEIFGQARQG